MAAPSAVTLDAVADLVRKSRLVPDDRLDELLAADPAADGSDLLHRLTASGLLTDFQSRQLARGKWRGFLLGNHYRLLEPLGKGGMGTVYLAEHTAMRRKVAVKVLSSELADDPVALKRFTREARAAARLDHPNVVHTIDIDPDAQPPYLVLEYVNGITLQQAVATRGTFAPETAAFCGVQALAGLQKAHELGLVHRDIKPANIVVDRKGVVKLLDLGIVRTQKSDGLTMAPGQQKVILGTADYLSPEQALNSSDVDTRADIYSLGSTLYFLLAGHPPFPNGTAARKLVDKQLKDPPPIITLRPDVSAGLSAVIARLLARSPADRYTTPAEAAAALVPFAAPEHGFPGWLFGQQAPDLLTTPPPLGRLPGDDTAPAQALHTMPMTGGSHLHISLPDEPPAEVEAPEPPNGESLVVALTPQNTAVPDVAPTGRAAGLWIALGIGAAMAVAGAAAWLTAR